MANPPKQKGTAAETAVVNFLQRSGFPTARRLALAGAEDCGDIGIASGQIIWEVKNYAVEELAVGKLDAFCAETERERNNAKAMLGILVVKRKGYGAPNAGEWFAYKRLSVAASCLAGFGSVPAPLVDPWVRMTLHESTSLLKQAGFL